MVRDPGGIRLGRKRMQGVCRKAMLEAQRRKGSGACRFVGTRDEAGLLPSALGTHVAQAFHGLTQQRMVQVPSGLKMPTQMPGLLAVDLERQFRAEKVGVVLGWSFVGCLVFFLTGGSLDAALSLWRDCSDTTIVHLFELFVKRGGWHASPA
jgi:hypothetical protein